MSTTLPQVKRHSPEETQALWAWLQARPQAWWTHGTPFGPKFGWLQIFEADNWHCIYCGGDLARSEDALAESTEEHLVPQSVFAVGKAKSDVKNNVAACCTSCNSLKGPACPVIESPAWKDRASYIAAMRVYIDDERTKRAARYPRVLELLLALWWSFLFAMCVAWALVAAVYLGSHRIDLAILHVIASTALAYCSYLFLLTAAGYWGLGTQGLAWLVVWRKRYAVIHALVVAITAFILAPTVELPEFNASWTHFRHQHVEISRILGS